MAAEREHAHAGTVRQAGENGARAAAAQAATPASMVERVYARWPERVDAARRRLGRPLTYTEKVLSAHLRRPGGQELVRGSSDADFDPDRVALQDALAQMVALQLEAAGLDEVAVPTTVHCDHLIRAREASAADLTAARGTNAEVYDFLRSFCARAGVGFWEPGSGIIHQVVLERYAFPGGMMVGTDSHTPNAGGLGMVAIGVGGGDAVDVMTGDAFTVRWPRIIGVRLSGSLRGWASPKDVVLKVVETLTVSGGTGAVLEYFGPGVGSVSATGRATICNMGAEVGATTSLFPFDAAAAGYLRAAGRGDVADLATAMAGDLAADPGVVAGPERFFDRVVDIDLSALGPSISGPGSPDLAHRAADVGRWARAHGVPSEVSVALIGSCTNSSYEDMARVAHVARQASARGLRARARLLVTPGSEQVRATLERDGLLADLRAVGATVLANACGPCIGQWERGADAPTGPNTIVSSFNRNFPGRNDGNADTQAFLTSPEMVLLYALAGTLDFDPERDPIPAATGTPVWIEPPDRHPLPPAGFAAGRLGYVAPPGDGSTVALAVSPTSERLQRLVPFPAWDGEDYLELPVLVKARGRCTTDHISPAGRWLRYRGHLERISGNLFLGAVNAFTGAVGEGRDPVDGRTRPLPEVAAHLAQVGRRWCVVGDENYGEGSSRELAAMEPRYRGGVAVLARSFARIHETNLKKQGMLPLTFADPATYDLVGETDRISVLGLATVAPGAPVRCRLARGDGTQVAFECTHTFTAAQLAWFRAGSALNALGRRRPSAGQDSRAGTAPRRTGRP